MPRPIVFDEPGAKVRLDSFSTRPPPKMTKAKAKVRFEALDEELFDLQDLLWGAKTHCLLLVLQGRDAAGKDGTVKHLSGGFNPRGVKVTSFGVPSAEEREHDFLWRVHRVSPRLGEVATFNRSHYEDVLVVRVHQLVKKSLWKARYDSINAFESTLAEHGCIILKYFLHISKEEQEKRLLEREKDPVKAWKINVQDWKERDEWDEYTEAYEDAIARCSAPHAPWMVVPADAKWYRNLVVAESVVAALRPYRKEWLKTLEKVGEQRRAEVAAWRAEHVRKGGGKEIERKPIPKPRPSDKRKRVVEDAAAAADGTGGA
jgi:PPK2 family polyphosphate:nucleotide phosphotransferase